MSQPQPPAGTVQAPQQQQGKPQGTPGTAKKGGRGKPREIKGFTNADLKIRRPQTVEERVKYRRKREERKPIQKAVDTLVLEAYKDWIRVGRPRKFVDMPLVIWEIEKGQKEEDARFMLGKAAMLIQRQLRYGDCPDTEDGKSVELSFYVVDRQVKVEGAPDNPPEDGHSPE